MAFDPNALVRQYGDPADEVGACRNACALFDFSFLARARVRGPEAVNALGQLTQRQLDDLPAGHIRYALREDRRGYLVSDLTIWRHHDHYDVMSGRFEDIEDLVRAGTPGCTEDLSSATSIFAIQGPASLQALSELADTSTISKLSYFEFTAAEIHGVPCVVGRLGYTGEAGFEIVLPRAQARLIWDLLAQKARPAGFIAADILRIEAGFVLFANEFSFPVTAGEAGIERFAGPRDARGSTQITLACFRARTRERPHLWRPSGPIDRQVPPRTIAITSACHSEAAGGTLGLGFALRSDVEAGVPLVDPSGIFTDIRLVSRPFIDAQKRRPRAAWATSHHRR